MSRYYRKRRTVRRRSNSYRARPRYYARPSYRRRRTYSRRRTCGSPFKALTRGRVKYVKKRLPAKWITDFDGSTTILRSTKGLAKAQVDALKEGATRRKLVGQLERIQSRLSGNNPFDMEVDVSIPTPSFRTWGYDADEPERIPRAARKRRAHGDLSDEVGYPTIRPRTDATTNSLEALFSRGSAQLTQEEIDLIDSGDYEMSGVEDL